MPINRILSSDKLEAKNDLTDSSKSIDRKKFSNSVLKGKEIKLKKPKMIVIPKSDNEKKSEENNNFQFEPIIEDQMINGLTVKCSCGNSSEVHFKYRKSGK